MRNLRFAVAVLLAVLGLSTSAEAQYELLGYTNAEAANANCWIKTNANYWLDKQLNRVLVYTKVNQCDYSATTFSLQNRVQNCASTSGSGCVQQVSYWSGWPGCGEKNWTYNFTGLANKYNCWRTKTNIECGHASEAISSWVCGSAN